MFRTELPIAPATDQLPRTALALTMGSCFADSIGARLVASKVTTLANPFGTVFQPLALLRLLRAAAGEDVDWQQHLLEAHGRWQSYDLHSSIGAGSPVEMLQTIQELVRQTGEFLRRADVVLLTLGTAWAYRLRETGELVSNCHKQNADLFVRELLTPDDIINALAETHAYVRRINPNLRFVLTVSPVRHLKDTLPLNSVSKSVLRLATHIASDLLPGVAYFPAYELLMDDLRDYRFYAADMLHPSEVAEDYIWEKFARTYFDAEFGRFRKDWAAIQQALGHRAMHLGAPEHRQFLESTLAKLEQLSLRKVDVGNETAIVQTQLAALPVPTLPVPIIEDDDEERIDIGIEEHAESAAVAGSQPNAPAAAQTDSRPPRLSPEEFRAQRNNRPARDRRDGRGKHPQPAEKAAAHPLDEERSTATASLLTGETSSSESAPELPPFSGELPAIGMAALPATPPTAIETASDLQEAGKKKKRRSRGGAKRTARKQALQLAAELESAQNGNPSAEPAATTGAEVALATTPDPMQMGQKSSVITKSVPVKRGGRRGISGQPLYAVLPAALVEAAALSAPAPTPAVTNGSVAAAEDSSGNGSQALVTQAPDKDSNGRNRNRKGRQQTSPGDASNRDKSGADAAATVGNGALPAKPAENAEPALLPAAETGVATTGGRNRNSKRPAPVVATPELATTAAAAPTISAAATPAPAAAPAAPAPRKSNRARRAATGGRAEKPAVDTPVIPVDADATPRTQVAAGRMMGSSASLVEAAAPKKKAAAPKAKTTAPKAAPVPAPTVVASKPTAIKPVVVPKAKPAAPKAAPVAPKAAPVPAPVVSTSKPATVKPKAAKAAKPKSTPAAEPALTKAPKPKPKAAKKPAKPE